MPTSDIPPAEQSIANIINTMHNIAGQHTPQGPTVGRIISPPPDIKVAWNSIELTKEQIYIDEYLLAGHTRTAKGQITSGTQEAGHHVHKHDIDNPYEETWILTDTLKAGDLVAVHPLNGDQLFIITAKLIYLGSGDGFEAAQTG